MGVSVEVLNESARTVTPSFYLCEKQTFAAQSKRIVHTDDMLFGSGDSVPAQTSWTITKVLSIPPQLPPTFFNCCMMKLEYRLKVFILLSQTWYSGIGSQLTLFLNQLKSVLIIVTEIYTDSRGGYTFCHQKAPNFASSIYQIDGSTYWVHVCHGYPGQSQIGPPSKLFHWLEIILRPLWALQRPRALDK